MKDSKTSVDRKGLVLFPARDSRTTRRRKSLLVFFVMVAAGALSWPIYPLFAGIRPLILGVPLSFAWIILWNGLVFLALVWLYRAETRGQE